MKHTVSGFIMTIFLGVMFLFIPIHVSAQTNCLSAEEAKKAISFINNPVPRAENQTLRRELLKMQETRRKLEEKIIDSWKDNQKLVAEANDMGRQNLLRLCEMIKENGWIDTQLAGKDGATAAASIVGNSKDAEIQKQIFPVIAAAVKKGFLGKSVLAFLIDGIRVGSGLPQIFGTQMTLKDELFYLAPLQDETRVDGWRKLYEMAPLDDFMKYLQLQYGIPVIKLPKAVGAPPAKKSGETTAVGSALPDLPDTEKDEVVKVESNLVNINVRVFPPKSQTPGSIVFQQSDFAVFEDGKEQPISFFSTTDAPFDLVLVLDLSGSTVDKQDLIRKSTQRFIEAARPADRIAIVTFTDEPKLVSGLSEDRNKLLAAAKKIGDSGGSGIWKAVEYTFTKIIKPENGQRRSAIILMTDGVDSSLLPGRLTDNSFPTFSHLLETVRNNNTTIIPVYLDTEIRSDDEIERAYREARRTLGLLADESGGAVYYASKVNDLSGIYEQLINDLGKTYSLGYELPDAAHDNLWHTLTVKLPNHPDFSVYAKKGFYAR